MRRLFRPRFWSTASSLRLPPQHRTINLIKLYSLRHSCATLLLSAETNPEIVSERLGHASIVLILDTYSHVLPDMQQEASDKLEKILFGEVGTLEAHQKEKAAG